jgi:predicted porin
MKNNHLFAAGSLLFAGLCGTAVAQSSMTIYGVADAALVYSNNQNGKAQTYMRSGNQASSRLGFKGTEDLGGGTSALYVLEAGLNLDDGTASSAGSIFNRQAFVGLANSHVGTVLIGRQYTPYYLFVGPLGQVNYVTGATGAHPGDIDGLDVTIRSSNAVTYLSPVWHGVQVSVLGAAGEQAQDKRNGDTFSAAIRYDRADWNFALGFQALRNGPNGATWDPTASSSFSRSPVNAGYLSADAVHYVAAAARHQIGSVTVGLVGTNVQYRPDSTSRFRDTAIFNTGGGYVAWQTASPWLLSAGVSYTRENAANGITAPANYRQVSLEQAYVLSKRTAIYLLEARQNARGMTLGPNAGPVDAVAVTGDSQTGTPSSTGTQNVFMAGLRHTF